MRSPVVSTLVLGLSLGAGSALQAERPGTDVLARIRAEGLTHSAVMSLAADLTDVHGPRLTGSATFKSAERYAVDTLTGWGLSAHLEPWGPFGRGWQLDHLDVSLTAPSYAPLQAYAKAWSPGTGGRLAAEPVLFDVSRLEDLAAYRGRLRGQIVLFAPPRPIPDFTPPAPLTAADLARLSMPAPGPATFQPTEAQRATAELYHRKWQLLYDEHPALVIEPSGGPSGSVYVTAVQMPTDRSGTPLAEPWAETPPAVLPQIVMAAEPYNRLARLARRQARVTVAADVAVSFDGSDLMSANVIGELPGADRAGEVVMIGGCFDSWHAATGATDNASGAAVLLEAMRILRAVGARPRRTIRVALWAGEEQGRLGSRAYVAAHFARRTPLPSGSPIVRTAEFDSLAGYFNVDWGPGRLRGIYLQGDAAAAPVFRAWFAPLADLGVSTVAPRSIGAADHVSFDDVGLPGFQFIREVGEAAGIAHTNMDVYDRLDEAALRQAAVVLASIAYEAAMADGRLPPMPLPTGGTTRP